MANQRTININIQGDSSDAQNAIQDAQRQLDDLARERLRNIDLTIDVNAGNVDAQIDRARRRLRALQDDLEVDGTSPGGNFISGFARGVVQGIPGVSSALSGLGSLGTPVGLALAGAMLAAVLGAVITFAPLIAATLIAGIGAGAVAAAAGLGITIAAQSDRVAEAASHLAARVKDVLSTAAQPLEGPVAAALSLFGNLLYRLEPQIQAVFGAIAPLIVPFANALVGLVENSMPGFVSLVETFAQLIPPLLPLIPPIGQALSDVMNQFARSPEAQQAFSTLAGMLLVLLPLLIQGIGSFLVWVAGFADDMGHAFMSVGRAASAFGQQVSAIFAAIGAGFSAFGALVNAAMAVAAVGVARAAAAISSAFSSARAAVTGAVSGVVASVSSGFNTVVATVTGAAARMLAPLLTLPARFRQAGVSAVEALTGGISSRIQGAIDTVSGLAKRLAAFLPGSPVKEGALRVLNRGYAGGQIVEMVTDGIRRKADSAQLALNESLPSPLPAGAAAAGSGGGGRTIVMNFDLRGYVGEVEPLMSRIREQVARVAGGNVQLALGGG